MPLVSQTFDQLLDFTRTTSGTFVGSNGLIQTTPASGNLLLWTQQFDNAVWQKFNGTITANSAVAPDGTSTADTLTAAAGTGFRPAVLQSTVATVAATVYTASFYVRPGTYTFLQIFLNAQTGEWVNYTLSGAGTATANGSCTASISLDSATGWYRITMTYTAGGTDRYPIFTMAASGTATRAQTWTTAGTETVFIWGAQLQTVPTANLVLGSELVTNGTFAGGSTTGWTAAGSATISGTGDVLTVTNGATAFGYAVTSITTVIGRTYYVTYQVTGGTSTSNLYIGTASGGFDNYAGPNQGVGSYTVAFVATATTTFLRLGNSVNTSGATSIFDNISAKEVTAVTGMPSTYTRNNGGVFPPRFDYDPVTLAAKGLLIEEQRTNLFFRSEDFTSGAWSRGDVTITANSLVSPDGTANADTFTATATGTSSFVSQATTVTATTAYTTSLFVKKGTADFANLTVYDSVNGNRYWFNLNTGVVASTAVVNAGLTNVSARIENFGNGWFRCVVTCTTKSLTSLTLFASLTDADASLTLTSGKTGYLYGAQLEAGAFATSYIPTVASQVTRATDLCSIVAPNFAPWYNQSEGTFVFEGSSVGPSTLAQTLNALTASDGTNNNVHRIGRYLNFWFGETRNGNVQQANPSATAGSYAQNATAKVAYAYKTNDFALSANGATAVTDTSGTVPTVITRLDIGGPPVELNGHIRSVRYYPTRLSNAQIQALTA